MSSAKQTYFLKEKQIFEGEIFDVVINEIDYNLKGRVEFRDCVFNKPLSLDNIKLEEDIYFFNCTFSEYSIIKNSKASKISFGGCRFGSEFILTLNKSTYLSFNSFKGKKIKLNGEHAQIRFDSLELDWLDIGSTNNSKTYLDSKIAFNRVNKVKNLNIKSSIVFAKIIFEAGTFDSVVLKGEFENSIKFKDKVTIESLFLESSTFNERIDFEGGNFGHVYFQRSSFLSLVVINGYDYLEKTWKNLNIKKVTLHSNDFKQNISLTLLKTKSIDLSNNSFQQIFHFQSILSDMLQEDYVMLNFDGTNQGSVTISDVFADVGLSGINFGDIIFKEMEISHLYINELKNNGKISFSNIKNIQYCSVQNTTIGDTEFLNVDLNKTDEVVISNSNLKGIDLSHYPKKIVSFSSYPKFGYGLKDKTKNNSNLRSIYNQLKRSAKSKGDVDTSVNYQSLEYKYLLKEKNLGFDKLLLMLNGLSNKNGKSWSRGVVFTLGVAFLTYWLYTSVIGIGLNSESWKDYISFISSFPKLYLEKHETFNSLWSVSLVIWLSRIFISYGIYQTISAFRKYGKG